MNLNGRIILTKRVRHFRRFRTIAQILFRNGFGWFIDEIGLTHLLTLPKRLLKNSEHKESLSMSERIRITFEQLGPTFVKFGQVASLRTDLFPVDLTEELAKLQDEVPPLSFATIRSIIETELCTNLDEIFQTFYEVPIGSASIGQVHEAILHSGERVAVKVQRPDIQQNIEVDFDILTDIARLAEKRFEWALHYELSEVVGEFRRTLFNELNYTTEAQNAERLRKIFMQSKTIYIPEIYWNFTTKRILVMEYIDGVKLSDTVQLESGGFDRNLLASRVSNAVFTQIFIHGFFHADPHPGNLAAMPSDVIAFMDFGMVGRLTPDMKNRLSGLMIGLMRRNTALIVRALYRMGVVPQDIDERKLYRDIEFLREKYYDIPLSQVNLGEAVADIFNIAYKHRIKIPIDLSLVGKTLLTIEGVVENLDPAFRIMDVAVPFGKKLLKEQLNPKTITRNATDSAYDLAEFAIDFPRQMKNFLWEIRHERIKAQLEIPEIQGILNKLDRISNRLSFSVILLALSIFMAGLMVASSLSKSGSVIWNVPFAELGLFIGALMVALLIWSIIRSGRM